MHTILHTHAHTQYTDTTNIYAAHTPQQYRTQIQQYAAHTEQNNTGATQRTTQPQRTEQHNLVHIVLIFIITHIYQKTL